uniref:Uncharacterized protein n=1 Tax=Arundo donax TaxID=35708 RepID=A0A0A9BG22_ARUDO
MQYQMRFSYHMTWITPL